MFLKQQTTLIETSLMSPEGDDTKRILLVSEQLSTCLGFGFNLYSSEKSIFLGSEEACWAGTVLVAGGQERSREVSS